MKCALYIIEVCFRHNKGNIYLPNPYHWHTFVYSGKFIRKGAPTILQTITGGQKSTQNDFVYGELGRTTLITKRYLVIVKYWFKILMSNDSKNINLIYRMMLSDMESKPSTVNWASLVKHLLLSLGFYEVWLAQGVGNYNYFISIFKQRLTDTFIQNWHSRLESSTRAVFYRSVAVFQFQPYLEKISISKFQKAFSRLRMSSHRLEIEAGRWARPNSIPLDDRKCRTCNLI